jgi:hypothetical protein
MKTRISDEVREQIKAEPDTMKYMDIARKYGISDATVNAIRGPKNGRRPAPSNKLAKRERPVIIDPPAEDATEYITCEISVPQLDKIYALLPAKSKAAAVLNGVEDLD